MPRIYVESFPLKTEGRFVRTHKLLALAAAIAVIGLTAAAPEAQAEINLGVNLGPAPVCPYGYYDYSPYRCAPYGFYGPEWFNGGLFIGAGPWFHGPHEFRGHGDNRLR